MYDVYSVESRKGGVGKTTIALNLAKTLVDQGYGVLFIDCDITGTPITKTASCSPFWKDIVNPIVFNGQHLNLIKYFEDAFLKGDGLEKGLPDELELEKEKVHLINSEIYDSDGHLIIDPRLLMDDLHSYWFVEMIREIADKFCSLIRVEKIAVILDNSPGFVGIGKSIREWLTSIGSDYVHFVLVSSLDDQDVEATVGSAVDIDKMMIKKWRIAYLHEQLVNHQGDFDELGKILDKNPELKDFFYSLEDGDGYPSNLSVEPEIKEFASVVLNKVPVIYHHANIGYIIKVDGSPERQKVVKSLFPLSEDGMPTNIIEYDVSISGQFIESNIYGHVFGVEQKDLLINACNRFAQKIGRYVESTDKVRQSASLNNSYGLFLKELENMGYGSLIDSLGDDLANQNFIQDLITYVRSLGNISIFEEAELAITMEDLQKKDKLLLTKFIKEQNLLSYSTALNSLFDTIYKKAGFSRKNSNKHLLISLSLFFRAFLGVQERLKKEEKSYRSVLIRGNKDVDVMKYAIKGLSKKDLFKKDSHSFLVNSEVENLFKNFFVEFYHKMCYAILRLIDCAEDYQIIMDACRATIERGGRTMDGDLMVYVRSVVMWKNEVFNRELFNALIERPFEMRVVKDAIIKWVLNKE